MYQELFDYLSQYFLLTEGEKQAIIHMALFRMYKRGHVLVEQGTYTANQIIVLKGCVRAYYTVDGVEKTTAFYTEFDGIEPPGWFENRPAPFSLACVEDSIIGLADATQQDEIFAQFPRFESLCRIITEERLAKQQSEFDAFRISSPEERYIQLRAQRPDLIQRVPQHQLASYLGMTPESLSRIRRRLAQRERVVLGV